MQEFRFTDPEGSLFASFYCPLIRSTADEKDFGRTGAKTELQQGKKSTPLSATQESRRGEGLSPGVGCPAASQQPVRQRGAAHSSFGLSGKQKATFFGTESS